MGLADRLRRVLSREPREPREPSGDAGATRIKVHLLLKGRIGDGWYDVDRQLSLPEGTTLAGLIERAEQDGLGLRRAIEESPHLRHTLMFNGERCPIDDDGNLSRALSDGDQIYLLAPLAGG